MEEEKKLYPFRLCSQLDEYSWGSEDFKVADLGYRDSLVREGWLAGNSLSEVMDAYLDRVTGDAVYDIYGRQFPVCVRHIRVHGRIPLRVCPDDEVAEQRYDSRGKEKLWYVLRAGKNAELMLGFRQQTGGGELYEACLDGSVEKLLNVVAPHQGQYFHIAPGTPHAAAGDVEILEISESSALDFCLCGWGEPVSPEEFDETLNLVDALDFIDYRPFRYDLATDGFRLISIPQFDVTRVNLKGPMDVSSEKADSFVLVSCIEGAISVCVDVFGQQFSYGAAAGETLLVPAECQDYRMIPSMPGTVIVETIVPPLDRPDAYINPNAPVTLPDDMED